MSPFSFVSSSTPLQVRPFTKHTITSFYFNILSLSPTPFTACMLVEFRKNFTKRSLAKGTYICKTLISCLFHTVLHWLSKYWTVVEDVSILTAYKTYMPITVAARSKAWNVFARWNAEIVGSNATRRMDAYVRLFCVCFVVCVGSGHATGWSPVQGVVPIMYRLRNSRSCQSPQGCT
jgi:hypothetical protein